MRLLSLLVAILVMMRAACLLRSLRRLPTHRAFSSIAAAAGSSSSSSIFSVEDDLRSAHGPGGGSGSSSERTVTPIPLSPPLPATKLVLPKLGAPQSEWTMQQRILYSELRAWRQGVADARKLPIFKVFVNNVIDGVVSELPRDEKELQLIKGVGPKITEMLVSNSSVLTWCQNVRDGVPLTSTVPLVSPLPASSSSTSSSSNTTKATKAAKSIASLQERANRAAEVAAIMSSTSEPIYITAADLNEEQRTTATRILDKKSNVFITGSAGTGKSFLLKYIIQELQRQHGDKAVAVTASTGIAAVNVGGQTVHSFAGIGLGKGDPDRIRVKVLKDKRSLQRWKDTQVLIIDEVSMIDRGLFELLDLIARSVKGNNEPFGGIQLVLVGDFLQLPPVRSSEERGTQSRQFCFESPSWEAAGLSVDSGGVASLRQVVRQSDAEFAKLLNEARIGQPSERLMQLLSACHVNVKPRPTDGIIPTKLYCVNKDVDEENREQLANLAGNVVVVQALDVWKHQPAGGSATKKTIADTAEKTIPSAIELKVGAQVMLTRNRPMTHGKSNVMNGSRGIVTGFQETVNSSGTVSRVPRVKFDNGESLHIGPVEFEVRGPGGDGTMIRLQVPLKLAWAMTVHKSQGCTLTRAELLLSNTFDYGQAYVALSRVTSLDGLWFTQQLQPRNIRANPVVLEFFGGIL